jgi:hypothetical protein
VGELPGIAGIEYPVRPMLAMPALRLPTNHPRRLGSRTRRLGSGTQARWLPELNSTIG